METPIGDDDDSHLGDFIEDTTTLAPAEAALHGSMRDVVKDVLDSLTPREAKVLRMRFGIEMSTDQTLEEVGKQFDVTRERIRQIEAKALAQAAPPEPLRQAEELPGRQLSPPRASSSCLVRAADSHNPLVPCSTLGRPTTNPLKDLQRRSL